MKKSYLNPVTWWLGALILACVALSTNAQTDPHPELTALVLKIYQAYQARDRETLFSFHSQSSPYFAEFKETIPRTFPASNVRIEGKRILIIKSDVQPDRAVLRVVVNMFARDIETGGEAEGFPEWDHTFYLVKEAGVWKIWRFGETAEEFADRYLNAGTDDARAKLVSQTPPLTYGFLKSLEEVGRSLLEDNGDDVHATEILNIDLRLATEAKNVWGVGGALAALGDVYFAQGDYVHAADNYQKVLTLAEKGGVKQGIAAMLAKLGNLHYAQGNAAQSMEYYLKSVRIYQELGSKLEITYPLANLGNAYFAQGNYEKALDQYQQILKIYEQHFSKSGAAWLRNQIADVYAAQGKNDLALVDYDLSLKAHEGLGNKPMQAYSLIGIGRVRVAEGKYAEALALFTRAAVLARAGQSFENLWKALNLQGQMHRALRQKEQARTAFAESIAVIEQLRGQVAGTERDRQLSFESKTAPYLAMVELLIDQQDLPGAFEYAERAKGRILLDVLRYGRAGITKSMTVDERVKETSLNVSLMTIGAQVRFENSLPQPNQSKLADMEDRLRGARLEYEANETRIYAAHPELKMLRGESRPLTLKEAEGLLPNAQTAWLEYVVAPEKTYLFVLTRADPSGTERASKVELKVFTIPITSRELARRVTEFRQTLARNSLGFKQAARQLYDLLLQPAQALLAGRNLVGIVPSDQLWELPFQALLASTDRYFLQDHALFYAPSLSVLREMRIKDADRKSASILPVSPAGRSIVKAGASKPASVPFLLALGNPTLSADLLAGTRSRDGSLTLNQLPDAEREVKTLGQIYGQPNSTILTGPAALEETVKIDAWRYPVLHFATHGVLDDQNPLYSRLLLASSDPHDDGMLEAREILKLELRANLVVLSACQTARGEIGAGEGLIGISWAFFIAGASTTVVSQWKVDSASTTRLMVELHRLLHGAAGHAEASKAEALRQAALKLMSDPKYSHPFYWSGFVVIGSGM